ncbi:MAG: hypothetical protein JSS30_07970 [Verrucomicrobia bacterium]|nr:hypothetical protein [Verrucomicrobiota bacterium]
MSYNINPTGKRLERDWELVEENKPGKFVTVGKESPLFNSAQAVEECAFNNAALGENEGDSKRAKETPPVLNLTDNGTESDFDFLLDPSTTLLFEDNFFDNYNLNPDDIDLRDLFNSSTDDSQPLNLADMSLEELFNKAEKFLLDPDLCLNEIKSRLPFILYTDKTGLEGLKEAKQEWESDKAFWGFSLE